MIDFSHLHELEERAVRIQERMRTCRNNDTQWKAQAVQLFQTEQEIADEREFLGLEDMDVDKLYAALSPEVEYDLPICESCGKTLTIHDPIATDGQSLLCFKCEQLEQCDACEHFHEMNETCGNCGKTWSGDVKTEEFRSAFARVLEERSMLDPDAPDAIVIAADQESK